MNNNNNDPPNMRSDGNDNDKEPAAAAQCKSTDEHDVYFGQGSKFDNHTGNKRMRACVESHWGEFEAANGKKGQLEVAAQVLKELGFPSFWKTDGTKANRSEAEEKISSCWCNKRSKLVREQARSQEEENLGRVRTNYLVQNVIKENIELKKKHLGELNDEDRVSLLDEKTSLIRRLASAMYYQDKKTADSAKKRNKKKEAGDTKMPPTKKLRDLRYASSTAAADPTSPFATKDEIGDTPKVVTPESAATPKEFLDGIPRQTLSYPAVAAAAAAATEETKTDLPKKSTTSSQGTLLDDDYYLSLQEVMQKHDPSPSALALPPLDGIDDVDSIVQEFILQELMKENDPSPPYDFRMKNQKVPPPPSALPLLAATTTTATATTEQAKKEGLDVARMPLAEKHHSKKQPNTTIPSRWNLEPRSPTRKWEFSFPASFMQGKTNHHGEKEEEKEDSALGKFY